VVLTPSNPLVYLYCSKDGGERSWGGGGGGGGGGSKFKHVFLHR
jgi:hypothetical protein